jgi:ribosomal peptide maturation radical SAM protein 1
MPFGPLNLPSIGLSLLRAGLEREQIPAQIEYLTFPFADAIGAKLYTDIADGKPSTCHLFGEWVFASSLFEQSAEQTSRYVEELLRASVSACGVDEEPQPPAADDFVEAVLHARAVTTPFLDEYADRLAASRPRIVGFTSVFQQQLASLALAKRLKERCPDVVILFGGANCEGVMGREVVRRFPFVDAVVSGEADVVLPDLVRTVLEGSSYDCRPGVFTAKQLLADTAESAPRLQNMDDLPFVDYADFFEQAAAVEKIPNDNMQLLFEASRGCWWGAKQHCTFCGLNGATMAFRSKSAGRALDELRTLSARHPGRHIQVVDNILDMRYFRDLIPALAEEGTDLHLFFEVKANLRKDQLLALRTAGIRVIQPGIESLSTPVLRLMRKGITGIQNVQLLKWCKELGIRPSWNLIWGFPGELSSDYEAMAGLMPQLVHLPPPTAASPLRLDRFSPLFEEAPESGITDVVPVPAYWHIYSGLPSDAVHNLAYYFGYSYARPQHVSRYTSGLSDLVARWQAEYRASDLLFSRVGERLLVWDLRPSAENPVTVLVGPTMAIYEQCDSLHSLDYLARQLAQSGQPASPQYVADLAAPLVARGLLMAEDDKLLSLAIPWGTYLPSQETRQRLEGILMALSARHGDDWVIPAALIEGATV